MSEQQSHLSETIGKIGKVFGWIAAITAGVSTLLSVAGFMLLQSHAHLLGVSRVFHHTVEDYLYQGGNFFITTLFWALPVSIIGNRYIWIAAGIIVVYLLGKRLKLFGNITQHPKTQEAFQQSWVRWIAIIAAAILFVVVFINHELSLIGAKDLLFATSGHPEMEKRATEEALKALEGQYVSSVLYVILSALILWIINHIHRDPETKTSPVRLYIANRFSSKATEHHVAKKIPENKSGVFSAVGLLILYLLFLVQLVLLPVQYGKTVYPNTFHRVSNLIFDETLQGKIPQSKNIYLLNERDDELVLYFGDTQEISLVKKENVLNIALKSRENIFER